MNLRQRIDNTGLKQWKIAEMLGVNYVTFNSWVNGSRTIPEEKKKELEQLLKKFEKVT